MSSNLLALKNANIKSITHDLQAAVDGFLRPKSMHLKEALSRGFGFHTYASYLVARENVKLREQTINFSHSTFVARYTELTDAPFAEAIGVALDGVRIEISIIKRSEVRQQAHRHSDVSYDIAVLVHNAEQAVIDRLPEFILPEFRNEDGSERFRVDSAHTHRLDTGPYVLTRGRDGKQLLNAKLIDGRWEGALYVYAPDHIADDSRCIKSVKKSLACAILPAVTSWVRCSIFRPDRYGARAARIQMSIGPSIRAFWGASPFLFDIPELLERLFIIESEFGSKHTNGKFVDGMWCADIYSNGVAEEENKTSLQTVKAMLLQSVHDTLRKAEYSANSQD